MDDQILIGVQRRLRALEANSVHYRIAENGTAQLTWQGGRVGVTGGVTSGVISVHDVTDYGVVGDGATDDTAALFSAAAAAESSGRPLFIPAGLTVQIDETFELWNGARIIGWGATLDILTDHSATGKRVFLDTLEGVVIDGLTLDQSNAAARNALYGMLSIEGGGDHDFYDLKVIGGESTGVWTGMDCERLGFWRTRVQGTWADGIHLSRGTSDWVIDHPWVSDCGDDHIGIVSVIDDGGSAYNQITDGVINGLRSSANSSRSGAPGKGIALVGCKNVTVDGGIITTPIGNGVTISYEPSGASETYGAADNTLADLYVYNGPASQFGIAAGESTRSTIQNCVVHDCDTGFGSVNATKDTWSGGKVSDCGLGFYETGSSGTRAVAMDIHDNSATHVVSTATLTGCVTT